MKTRESVLNPSDFAQCSVQRSAQGSALISDELSLNAKRPHDFDDDDERDTEWPLFVDAPIPYQLSVEAHGDLDRVSAEGWVP